MKRGALALAGLDRDLAVVVAGDVADDGQAEAGAAGVAAAGPVDPVEALEDPLEVAGAGCRCRGRATAIVDPAAVGARRGTSTTRARRRSTSRRCRAGCRRPRRAGGGRRPRRGAPGALDDLDGDAALLGRPGARARPPRRRTRCDGHGVAARPPRSASMRRQLEQVVDGAADPDGLVQHPLGQAVERPRGRPRRAGSRPAGRARRPASSARG